MWRSVWQKFRVEQKRSVPFLFQFLTCVLNRAKFLRFFSFFFLAPFFSFFFFLSVLRAAGLQRAFTVKPNCARGNCPLPSLAEDPINQGIHRLSHLCLRARGSDPPRFRLFWLFFPFFFLPASNVSIKPAEWPASRLGDRWVRCSLPLGPRAAPAVWEGVRGTSF